MTQSQALIKAVSQYRPDDPIERASTIPSAWYTSGEIAALEANSVWAGNWVVVGRIDQVRDTGAYLTAEVAGEPLAVVRGADGRLRAFFNVCRHHAAAVLTEACGRASVLQCPYHGWTYALDGALKATPQFEGVQDFDRASNGLVPVEVDTWEQFVFVRVAGGGPSLPEFVGTFADRARPLGLEALHFVERRVYDIDCNWKVFVDNYLDGGYHVPYIHKALGSVLDNTAYRIENEGRICVQSCAMEPQRGDAETASVRRGDMAYYIWLYPNFMLNWYEGVMDTNLVLPLGVDRCRVIFDFFFSEADPDEHARSVAVAERVQQEDIDVCMSVQKGLRSRAYDVGRLSVRREAGEHLFHRLLHADLSAALTGAG